MKFKIGDQKFELTTYYISYVNPMPDLPEGSMIVSVASNTWAANSLGNPNKIPHTVVKALIPVE